MDNVLIPQSKGGSCRFYYLYLLIFLPYLTISCFLDLADPYYCEYGSQEISQQQIIAFLKSEGAAIREYDDSLVRKFIDCIMVYDYSITIRFKTGKEISKRV